MYCLEQVTEVIAVVVHCVRYLLSTFSCGDLLPERDSLVRSDYLQIHPQATTTLTLIFLTSLFGHLRTSEVIGRVTATCGCNL